MDFTTRQWVISIIVVVILAIIIDGFRRMKRARRDSLHMSLDPKNTLSTSDKDNNYGSEFPNGGARPSEKSIDKGRFDEVKSQYDYGRDISAIIKKGKKGKKPSGAATETSDIENQGQWVDEDEGDEEYYARKWDEDYDKQEGGIDDEPVLDEPAPIVSEHREATFERSHEATDLADNSVADPEQVSLNLEETVPVLMESVEDESGVYDESHELSNSREEPLLDSTDDDIHSQQTYEELGDEGIAIRPVGKHIRSAIEPTIDEEENLDVRSANKPRYRSKYFASEVQEEAPTSNSSLTEVLVINVRMQNQMMQGGDLLESVLDNGLRYGEMNIFHCHADEDGEGPVLFSMANMLKPGTFDLKTMDSFSTVGVTFFLTLPVFNNQNMAAYEVMLSTAKNVASALGAELNDDQRSIMTAQTMEHYRERIRDFSRRQQLEKNK